MVGLMDWIKGPQAAPANPAAPAQAQTQQPNPTQPAAFQQSTTTAPQTQEPASPLDNHKDLFTIPTMEGQPAPTINDPYINMDPTTMSAEIAKINFTAAPEMQNAILAAAGGNPEMAQNFSALLNMVSQNIYGKAATLSATLADQAARTGVTRLQGDIPNTVRSSLTNESMAQLNPAFKHEALSPMVNAVKQQFEKRYPNATSAEIVQHTNTYLTDIAKVFNPQTQSPQDRAEAGQDFSSFFIPT